MDVFRAAVGPLEGWGSYLGLLDDVGELPAPHEAVFGREEEEAVAAVQGAGHRLHQTHLHVSPAWAHTHTHTLRLG